MRWIIVVLAVACLACTTAQAPEPEATPTPTATATSTPTPTPRATWAVDPRVERNKAIWAAMAAATPRPIPTPRYDQLLSDNYKKFAPHWEYGPDRAWLVGETGYLFVLDCATGDPELYIEIRGDPLPGDGQDSIEVVWRVRDGPLDGTPDTWAKSADGRTLHASGVFELHVLAGAPWAGVHLDGADVLWFAGPDATIDTSRLSCVP